MKAKGLLPFLLFCQCFTVFSQESGPQYTRSSKGLRGKVRELVSTTYSIRESGGRQQISKLYGYRYIYYPDGFMDSSFSAHLYDSLKWVFDYHYYWKGDTLCSTVHGENAWVRCRFNNKQHVIYHEFFSEKSMRQYFESFYEYDSLGRLVRLSGRNDPPGKGIVYQYKKNPDGSYTQSGNPDYKVFNAKQQLISYVTFNNAQTSKSERNFFYNDEGDLLTEKEIMYKKEWGKWVPLSNEGTTKTYRYQYDQAKNWISKESTYNGKPFELEKRIILYWE